VDPLTLSGCPPLRPAWNLEKLWAGLADGAIDVVGSDHCSWRIEEKSVGADDFSLIPHGIPALETQLPTLWSVGVGGGARLSSATRPTNGASTGETEPRVTANRLVEVMATAPAMLHGLYPRKGTIEIGSDADLVLFDDSRRETVSQARLHSRAGYEPCEGMEVVGWPVATFLRGELIARNGEIVARPGRGQLLRRQPPPQ
jgi:dihydropyrimidinase